MASNFIHFQTNDIKCPFVIIRNEIFVRLYCSSTKSFSGQLDCKITVSNFATIGNISASVTYLAHT